VLIASLYNNAKWHKLKNRNAAGKQHSGLDKKQA
jgi:hypothetical protein